jgi:hypothetical protein
MTELADDPRLRRTRFVVIDFEGLTSAGRPPVPVERPAHPRRDRGRPVSDPGRHSTSRRDLQRMRRYRATPVAASPRNADHEHQRPVNDAAADAQVSPADLAYRPRRSQGASMGDLMWTLSLIGGSVLVVLLLRLAETRTSGREPARVRRLPPR